MAYLSDEAKNLAVRLGKQGLDKKVEKAMKQDMLVLFRRDLDEWMQTTSVSPGTPSADEAVYQECRLMSMNAFNFLAVKEGCYLGLHGDAASGKEWAMRIMGNVINFGERK